MAEVKIVSVIGPSGSSCTPEMFVFGEELGKSLIDHEYRIACGGMDGIMEAVCKGARSSDKYQPGATIGIIPFADKSKANPFCDIVIPTGLGIARNQIVVNTGDVVVAIAGGAGTLSEIAFAWQFNKRVICYEGFGGWSEKMAGERIDSRRDDRLLKAATLDEIMEMIND